MKSFKKKWVCNFSGSGWESSNVPTDITNIRRPWMRPMLWSGGGTGEMPVKSLTDALVPTAQEVEHWLQPTKRWEFLSWISISLFTSKSDLILPPHRVAVVFLLLGLPLSRGQSSTMSNTNSSYEWRRNRSGNCRTKKKRKMSISLSDCLSFLWGLSRVVCLSWKLLRAFTKGGGIGWISTSSAMPLSRGPEEHRSQQFWYRYLSEAEPLRSYLS